MSLAIFRNVYILDACITLKTSANFAIQLLFYNEGENKGCFVWHKRVGKLEEW